MSIEFTDKIYKCLKCGAEMEGYIEDKLEGEHAGCVNCCEEWKVSELKKLKKVVFIFR